MQSLLVVALMVFSACASGAATPASSTTSGTPRLAGPDDAQDPDVTCEDEVRTGTHLEKKICRSQAEKDQDRRFVEDLILNPASRAQ